MKIDIEIPDITQDAVIEAMAARLLGLEYDHSGDPDDPTPPPDRWNRKAIGKHLRSYFEVKVAELAEQAVRRVFDEQIRARIVEAIDAVLAAGWEETNSYGERVGTKLDLKGRIGKLLLESRGDSYSRNPSIMDATVKAAIEGFLGREFQPVIEAAKENLKKCLDAKVMKTVSDTITNAVGLR